MEGQLVENPDGTPAVVVPVDSKGTSKITNQPQMQLMPDPWKQQDATALNELARMRKQDAADRTDLSAEVRTLVQEVHRESDGATVAHATYATYNAQGGKTDDTLRAVITTIDTVVSPAINNDAGGGPTALEYTGASKNDWLERLHAQDAAVKAAIEQTDNAVKGAA